MVRPHFDHFKIERNAPADATKLVYTCSIWCGCCKSWNKPGGSPKPGYGLASMANFIKHLGTKTHTKNHDNCQHCLRRSTRATGKQRARAAP
jgi:hypothetical protein